MWPFRTKDQQPKPQEKAAYEQMEKAKVRFDASVDASTRLLDDFLVDLSKKDAAS